jgi:hypothetical protein
MTNHADRCEGWAHATATETDHARGLGGLTTQVQTLLEQMVRGAVPCPPSPAPLVPPLPCIPALKPHRPVLRQKIRVEPHTGHSLGRSRWTEQSHGVYGAEHAV